jgi:hypothetical protein
MSEAIEFEGGIDSVGEHATSLGLTMMDVMLVASLLVFLAFVIKLFFATVVTLFQTAMALIFLYFLITK